MNSSMKKICFLIGNITRTGGTEKVTCQIAFGLANDFNVYILSLYDNGGQVNFDLSNKILRKRLSSEKLNSKKDFIRIIHRIRSFVKKYKIDILIDVDTVLDMYSVPALIGLKTKLVSWEHFNFSESMGTKFRVPFRKYITRFSDCVVTLTKEDQKMYKDYFGNRLRIEHIYNPIELTTDNPEYNIMSKTIITVGRLVRVKGYDYLMDVAEKVFDKHPDWELLILGEGEERLTLEQTIAKKNLKQVKLLGRISNVDDYLKKAAVFVMTSRNEGFPLVLIEAKSNNLPVVSFRCKTGPAELVQDNVNGYLIDCFDIDKMADKICYLIENPEIRERFSKNAKLDTEKMNYDMIMQQWKELLLSF